MKCSSKGLIMSFRRASLFSLRTLLDSGAHCTERCRFHEWMRDTAPRCGGGFVVCRLKHILLGSGERKGCCNGDIPFQCDLLFPITLIFMGTLRHRGPTARPPLRLASEFLVNKRNTALKHANCLCSFTFPIHSIQLALRINQSGL